MTTIHVMPTNDLVEHESNDDCWCGPVQEPVQREFGYGMNWVAIHSALDGRP